MKVVGVTGYARHGKNTVGQALERECGAKQYAFSNALKEMALVLNPFVDREMHYRLQTVVADRGWEEAKQEPEVRRFLQVLGTEAVRDMLGEDSWIDALAIQLAKDEPDVVTVTDLRFPNEAEWVWSVGGEVWRVERLNVDGTLFDNGLGTGHSSESLVTSIQADRVLRARTVWSLQEQAVAAFYDGFGDAVVHDASRLRRGFKL